MIVDMGFNYARSLRSKRGETNQLRGLRYFFFICSSM